MRKEVAAALTGVGYSVSTAATGVEALRLADDMPDIMLVDLVLPDISGISICRAVRGRPRTAQIPIVVLTADSRPETVAHAFRSGANDFIEKPFAPEVLVLRINRIVRERLTDQEMARRFDELTEAHAALAAARADLVLQQRLSALGLMISGLAHEMNSPLGALLASLQFVLEGRADSPEDAKDALTDALKAGERVAELVKRMRSIAGSDDQTRVEIALRRRIELAASSFSTCQIDVVGQEISVWAVEAELREALGALLDNAVRAASASPHPRVCVAIDGDPDFVNVVIDDNGAGIDPRDVPFLLTPFFTRNRCTNATGLGLSMVDAMARRHGGHVTIDAKGPLGGARATLVLPRAPPAEAATTDPR
jgi:signal transduction histidine kinase